MAKASKDDQDKPVKTSFMVRPSRTRQMKYICLTDETIKTPSQLIDLATADFIAKWEKTNGRIPFK